MTLTEFFEQSYFYFLCTIFGFIIVLGTFIISLLRTQKLPLIQLCITGAFLLLIFFKPLCVLLGVTPSFKSGDMHFDLFIVILSAILIIADQLVYLLFTNGALSKKSLFVLAPDKTGKLIYIYQDHKGRIALFNKHFINELDLSEEEVKNWKKLAQNYVIDGGNYLYKDFVKKLALAEEGPVEFTIQFEGKDVKFELEKINILDDEEFVGSIYVKCGCCCDKKEEPALEEEAPEAVAPVEEAPVEEEKAEEETPVEEEKAEEEAPAEEEKAEEKPAEEKEESLSMDELNKVDLDNSFLDEKDEK